MNKKAIRMTGLILLIVGVAVLVYGVMTLTGFGNSAAGSLLEGARRADRALLGGGNVGLTNTEKKAILILIAGGFGTIVGAGLLITARRI